MTKSSSVKSGLLRQDSAMLAAVGTAVTFVNDLLGVQAFLDILAGIATRCAKKTVAEWATQRASIWRG